MNHDCQPISMLMYIMLAYLMLLTALYNAVCLYNAYFFLILCSHRFLFFYYRAMCSLEK